MSRRSPAKAVSPFVPHSATALHAFAPHGKRRYGVRWEGRSPPHRFGWKTFPYAKNAENIQPSLTAPSVLHCVVCAGAMSSRSPAKAVSPFVPHSATALHALALHGKRRYGVRWEGRSPPHRFGWKTFPCAKNAENIQPSLTAPAVLHRVVSAGTMSSRSPAKAVSPFVPHSATALHALAPPVPPRACVRAPATVSIRPR
jgi:hypothetical protein